MGDFNPMPSPDGTHIAFIRERTFSRSAVFVLPLTAGGAPAGSAAQLTPESWNVNGVAWTPDGQDLLFSWGGHFGLSRLSRVSATSSRGGVGQPTALPFGEQATALAISKSGRVVYSARFRDTALYEAPLSGSSHQPLAGSGFSSTFDEQTPHYSPDGARLPSRPPVRAWKRSGWPTATGRTSCRSRRWVDLSARTLNGRQMGGRSSSTRDEKARQTCIRSSPRPASSISSHESHPTKANRAGRATDDGFISGRTSRGGKRSGESRPTEVIRNKSRDMEVRRQPNLQTEGICIMRKIPVTARFDLACASRRRHRGACCRWIELFAQFRRRRPWSLFPGRARHS